MVSKKFEKQKCFSYLTYYSSPLGEMTMSSDGEKLTGLWFAGQKYFGSTISCQYKEQSLPIFAQTIQWLEIYFQGKIPAFMPEMLLETTPFRKAVWEILLRIPYGATMTYGEIAKEVAKQKGISRMSAQAVGGAVGHNPISVIIPCHRVIGADGSLTGYAGGIERKKQLLLMEREYQIL